MKTKLHIFKVVAEQLSFTKASERLFISQPAVSKTIKNLEEAYKSNFFIRRRNSIELTEDGKSFLIYVNRILKIYDEMDNQFLNLKTTLPEQIQFGASTTVATYIIPKILAKIKTQYPQVHFEITSGNSEEIESLILSEQLNFGITEGKHNNQQLHFKKFIKDEIVLVTNAQNKSIKNNTIDKSALLQLPIVERELGSGTKDVIYSILKENNISKLNTILHLNSTEAIKNYLYHSDSYALLSINALTDDLMNNKLKVIDIKDMSMERWFYFVSRTGYNSKVMEYFEKTVRSSYNF
ncbi:LysR substrate-binding domain-containing protein [Gelidibacter maritimus]|uniref:LysR family transcriptional regulator n=1 Tax=Gelidibacter maritimus TaxID=2761487 RepID=A0A7W2M5X8_9FLAO|nr:LysR substrate-binding domain-containing protein [Gelidibacter maritimus]MBA6153322.1 LysR family transcriptional regulator [Gelidibacter maritimus]